MIEGFKNISNKKILLMIGIISTVVLILAAANTGLDHSFFVKLLFDDAQEFASKGIITSNFMPIGYSGFLGACIKVGGTNGIPICQSFIYIGVLLAAFWLLKLRDIRGIMLAIGTLIVALHPALLLNVWRVHDGNLTVLLLLGFLASGISFMRSRSTWSIVCFGIFSGLLFATRPNTIALIPAALFVLWMKNANGENKYVKKTLVFLASTLILIVAVNFLVRATPFFFGGQGFYNLFAGSNEYTSKYLLKDYSGENSLGEALAARGFASAQTFPQWLAFPSDTYKKLAIDYVAQHPLQYAELGFLKLYTLLRPGYHMVQNFSWDSQEGLKWLLKIVLALPFFIWAFFVYKDRKNFMGRENLFVFIVVVLYILPFLAANSDPRYRFPLDIIFIIDSFCRAKKYSIGQKVQ